jgi:hypothetical protein
MAVVKAFAITSLPFVLMEAATGVLSFATGILRMPPSVGVGTVADLIILLAGVGVVVLRKSKMRHPEAKVSENLQGE